MGQYKSQHTGPQIDAGVDAALNPDVTVTPNSDALVTSGAVADALENIDPTITSNTDTTLSGILAGNGSKVTTKAVDSVPTASSTNLVESGGVKSALDNKQNTLTFDSTPTSGSTNPVTSAGIRAAIDQVNSSPLVAATASAMTDTSKVYVYIGSEAGYTNGHWYYYNGSAWADGGVYNAVAVNTDTTLTLSGAPADAKAAGDAVSDLKSALYDNEIIDVFEDGTYSNSTWRGVTLTWNGKVAHVVGTATGGNFISPNIFVNANGFPANISAGDILNVNISRTTANVFVNIYSYVSGSLTNEAQIGETQKYTIPANATGLLIRLLVYNGATVNGDISFTITKSATVKSQETVLPTILPTKDSIVDTIEAVLNKYGVAVLGKGTYELTRAINMPNDSMIKGAGEATVIQAATGADAIVVGASCAIESVKIHSDDGHTNSAGTTAGIRVSANYDTPPLKYNIKISNVTIDGFSLAGIYGTKTGTWVGDSISAVNCTIFNCYAGIFLEDYSEFGRYTNIMCRDNYIGLYNKSGNNVFENCSFSNNTVGVYLVGDDGDNSRNNGHGTLVGCTINHSNDNNGFAVICKGISANGFVFNSCQVWYGKIQVKQSSGIIFDGCMFGAYNTETEIINYTANDLFLMNCLFKVGATFSGSGGETHAINCYKFDGTPITA